jgi:hypothetical protein
MIPSVENIFLLAVDLDPWPGWASPWLWTSDTWAGLQFGVLVVALAVAWRQASEAVRLREDSTRPFITIDFSVERKVIHLSVANTGPSMARNVRFTFDPPLRSSLAQEQISSLKMLGPEGIPTLPPGKVMTTVFDSFPQREAEGGYDDAYNVKVAYDGERGRSYSDEIVLDLGVYRDRLSMRTYEIHDVGQTLEKIQGELQKWTAMGGGLLRLSPTELRDRFHPPEEPAEGA